VITTVIVVIAVVVERFAQNEADSPARTAHDPASQTQRCRHTETPALSNIFLAGRTVESEGTNEATGTLLEGTKVRK